MLNIVQTKSQLDELFAFIGANERLAYDIETTGLAVRKDRIIGFSIANSTRGYYVPFLRWDIATGSLIPAGLDKSDIQAVLHYLSDKKLITFNGAFDLPFTKNFFGVDLLPALCADVMLMAHTVDENRRSYALKEIAADYFGEDAKQEQLDMFASIKANGGSAKEYFKADLEPMAIYAIQDGVLTSKLFDKMLVELREDGLEDFFFTTETMPLYREVTIPMEQTGLLLDMPYVEGTYDAIRLDIEKLEGRIQDAIKPHLGVFEQWFLRKDYPYVYSGAFAQQAIKYYGGDLPLTASGAYSVAAGNVEKMPDGLLKRWLLRQEDLPEADIVAIQKRLWASENTTYMFNLNSRHHLKKLFFDTFGEKTLSTTPTGQNQADEEFIESMAPKYEWAANLIVYYKLMKLKGTYIERYIQEQENGRFYPKFFQHRTVSGRYSGDLQQLPRPVEGATDTDLVAKYTNRIRNFFIADPGAVLIDADYESLEPHVFAHVSGDEAIKDIFRNGLDFYSEIIIRTEGLTEYSAKKDAENYLGRLSKTLRQSRKPYCLGIPYGMTGYKLQFELGVPLELAERLVKNYLAAFPALSRAIGVSHSELLETGCVSTEASRMRRMPRAKELYEKYGKVILDDLELWKAFHDSPGVYAKAKQDRREFKNYLNNAFNVKVQGLAANIVNRASIALARAYKAKKIPAVIVANVHDELLVSCDKRFAEVAAKMMQNIMENNYKLSIPLKAVPVIGLRYGEVK